MKPTGNEKIQRHLHSSFSKRLKKKKKSYCAKRAILSGEITQSIVAELAKMSEEHFPPPSLIFIKIQINITSEIRQEDKFCSTL